MKSASDVLQFWFGELDEQGIAPPEKQKQWFTKSDDFDETIRTEFLDLYDALASGQVTWNDQETIVAAIIVLDQFSRNMFRNTAKMYATDPQALDLALHAIKQGWDKDMPLSHRVFSYMPLMHSENILHQETCVQLFTSLHDELKGQARKPIADNIKYAEMHRDIILKFERFPHRNDILSRESTAEEIEFLKQDGSSF